MRWTVRHRVVRSTSPSNDTVTVNADGSFTYTPNAGFTGTDAVRLFKDAAANGGPGPRSLGGVNYSDARRTTRPRSSMTWPRRTPPSRTGR